MKIKGTWRVKWVGLGKAGHVWVVHDRSGYTDVGFALSVLREMMESVL